MWGVGIDVGEEVSSVGIDMGRMVFGGRGLVPQRRWTGRWERIVFGGKISVLNLRW